MNIPGLKGVEITMIEELEIGIAISEMPHQAPLYFGIKYVFLMMTLSLG